MTKEVDKNNEFLRWIHGDNIPEDVKKEVLPTGVTVYSIGKLNVEKYTKTALALLS